MEKVMNYLNGMKSRCFILFVCLALMASVTSCSEDYFEDNIPENSKQLSKKELIEQALSRLPQTRGAAPYPVVMATTKSTVSISCYASEPVIIHWGDGETTLVSENDYSENIYTYSDNELIHPIYIETSNEAIISLNTYANELIFLDVTNNINLETLICAHNGFDELDLTGCLNLRILWAGGNNLSSIDLTRLPHLLSLSLPFTQLTDLDLSGNLELEILGIGYNQITDLDLTNNTALWHIEIPELSINTLNNLPISAKSFAIFPKLEVLEISGTPFDSLDLSDNPLVRELYIAGTAITQLDISNLQIERLNARKSQLTNLKYTLDNLSPNCDGIDIINTPFESNFTKVSSLISSLPDRRNADEYGVITQGRLYTKSSAATLFRSMLTGKNWEVYSE